MFNKINFSGKNGLITVTFVEKKVIVKSKFTGDQTESNILLDSAEPDNMIEAAFIYLEAFLSDCYSERKDELKDNTIKFRFNHENFIDAINEMIDHLQYKNIIDIEYFELKFTTKKILSKHLIMLKSAYLTKNNRSCVTFYTSMKDIAIHKAGECNQFKLKVELKKTI
jgi:hypothetical protein